MLCSSGAQVRSVAWPHDRWHVHAKCSRHSCASRVKRTNLHASKRNTCSACAASAVDVSTAATLVDASSVAVRSAAASTLNTGTHHSRIASPRVPLRHRCRLLLHLKRKRSSEDVGIMFSEASASSTANSCWHLHAVVAIRSAVVEVVVVTTFHCYNHCFAFWVARKVMRQKTSVLKQCG